MFQPQVPFLQWRRSNTFHSNRWRESIARMALINQIKNLYLQRVWCTTCYGSTCSRCTGPRSDICTWCTTEATRIHSEIMLRFIFECFTVDYQGPIVFHSHRWYKTDHQFLVELRWAMHSLRSRHPSELIQLGKWTYGSCKCVIHMWEAVFFTDQTICRIDITSVISGDTASEPVYWSYLSIEEITPWSMFSIG